jgi:hypothetical protein
VLAFLFFGRARVVLTADSGRASELSMTAASDATLITYLAFPMTGIGNAL